MSKKEKAVKQNLDQIDLNKIAVKEAIDEWMNRNWKKTEQNVGKWVIRLVALSIFSALIYFLLWANGWHKA